jgi:RNA polymerase sigma-70 factor (ECF subfamily)
VAATREGDLEAFEELVRRYRVRMTRLAYRFTQNVEDARYLSQDGFVRAY